VGRRKKIERIVFLGVGLGRNTEEREADSGQRGK